MEFHGFQTSLPPILSIFLAIGLIVLAWYSYSRLRTISGVNRWILISLRSSAFILILLLILNPYFYSSDQVEVEPEIAVFFDNSESTTITKSDYNGLESYKKLIQDLDFEQFTDVNFSFYSFGQQVKSSDLDSLDGSAISTDLSGPVESVLEMSDDVKAAILISDGIITYGRNPVISSFNSSIPIYTIGLGDTSNVRDIALSNLTTNTTGYTNTNHVVEAEVSQTGFEGSSINLELRNGDQVLGQQRVSFETNDQTKTVNFEISLSEPGLKQYEIVSIPLNNEWTQDNNTGLVSIDVIDSRVRILHLAFNLHPDVKALRTLIETDENNILYPLTWVGQGRYIEDIPEPSEREFDLIIIQGLPDSNIELPFLEDLSNIPTVFLDLGMSSSVTQMNSYRLISTQLNPAYQVQLSTSDVNSDHSILELPNVDKSELPTLRSPRRSTISDPTAETLFRLVYNGVETAFPALAVSEIGNVRRAHVLPWGWYKMSLSSDPDARQYYQDLFTNIISWTSNNPDDRLLRVIPENRIVNTSVNPVINGFVRNERGDPEPNAVIEIQIEGNNSSIRTFNMDNTGEGTYRLELPKLSEGIYTYTATARKSGRTIETQNGEFLVTNTSNEHSDTFRNDALLRSIANNSGGSFYVYDEINGFWDDFDQAGLLEKDIKTIESYTFPVRNIYWFLILILILGAEWMLRKYYSLP